MLSLLLAEAEVIAEQRGTPPLVLLDDVLSELDASRRLILAERIGRVGQAVVTATGADALPLEPAQLLEVTPGVVSSTVMERLDAEVRRELDRFGPIEGDTAAIVRAWPHAVGETVARNAWPARIARDGTLLVHTASSTWAFELGRLAETILTQLRARARRGDAAGAQVRSRTAAGRPRRRACAARPAAGPESTPGARAEAAEIAAGIEDDELRELVARAAAASLANGPTARPPDDRGF